METTEHGASDWEDFEAAAKRPIEQHIRNSFIHTYKPVLDDAEYRSFDTSDDDSISLLHLMQLGIAADKYSRRSLRVMSHFEWTERCSVGIPELDTQHRHLIELLGELERSMQSGESEGVVAEALKELSRYAETHLQREELVLRVRGYPGYLEHKAEHDDYRLKLASLQFQSERGNFGVKLTNFVTEWWRFHVLGSDQQYARYFRNQTTKV